MGGDHGPSVVVPGAALALERHPGMRFLIFGDEAAVRPLLDAQARSARKPASSDIPTVAVRMEDKPSAAVRAGRWKSSMWLAIQAVRDGEADAAVSAGNTGALMAMAKICLKTMASIERPAIAALWPTLRGESVVLDVGATIGADAMHLVDMAIMGAAMARILFDLERPTVGLLNVGIEEMKGIEIVKEAAGSCARRDLPNLAYHGFVEGDDLGKGTVDVVVTEGFTGNIALKTAEGTAKQIGEYLRARHEPDLTAKIGYLFARQAFDALREKMDPRKVNGGVFLGLDGVVIKSHGGTDALGFASAIDIGYDMAHYELMRTIRDMLEQTPAGRLRLKEPDPWPPFVRSSAATAPICRSGFSPTRNSPRWSTPRTSGSSSAPASRSATSRPMARPHPCSALKAAELALEDAGLEPADIDLIVCATSTPDYTFPSTATQIQAGLGITHGAAFDLQAVCTGFVYGVATADKFLTSGSHKRALVIGAETFSRILDWNDRTTCVLFGDGAGAIVLEAQLGEGTPQDRGVLTSHLRSDGSHREKLYVRRRSGLTRRPPASSGWRAGRSSGMPSAWSRT